jgi:hypothetical protein
VAYERRNVVDAFLVAVRCAHGGECSHAQYGAIKGGAFGNSPVRLLRGPFWVRAAEALSRFAPEPPCAHSHRPPQCPVCRSQSSTSRAFPAPDASALRPPWSPSL